MKEFPFEGEYPGRTVKHGARFDVPSPEERPGINHLMTSFFSLSCSYFSFSLCIIFILYTIITFYNYYFVLSATCDTRKTR